MQGFTELLLPNDAASTPPESVILTVVPGVMWWAVPMLHLMSSQWQNPQTPMQHSQSVCLVLVLKLTHSVSDVDALPLRWPCNSLGLRLRLFVKGMHEAKESRPSFSKMTESEVYSTFCAALTNADWTQNWVIITHTSVGKWIKEQVPSTVSLCIRQTDCSCEGSAGFCNSQCVLFCQIHVLEQDYDMLTAPEVQLFTPPTIPSSDYCGYRKAAGSAERNTCVALL